MVGHQTDAKYKNSGIEYLEEIPDLWQAIQLKRIVNIFGRIGFRGYTVSDIVAEGEGAITLSPSNITGGKINYLKRTYISWYKYQESLEIQVFNGDILFVKTGSTIGKTAIVENAPEPMTINPQLVVLKDIRCDSNFLSYVMNSDYYQFQVYGYCFGGSTPAMTQESLGKTIVAYPVSLQEQKSIAHFLDCKTADIDILIAKKQRLIQLLEEKRTALIDRAVTKGLNPIAPMKDSGSDWISEIPAHWEVRQLKYLCVLQRGFDLPSQERKEGHYPIYGGGGITGYHNTAMVQAPGIVTGRYGTVGEVYLVEEPFWPLNTSLYVKEFWGNSPTFIKYLLSVIPIKSYSAKSAVPGVDRNDLHIIPVARPPREEQDLIVQYLEQASNYKQRMTETIERQIEKLQEYRRSLITAAVTGKLDIEQETTS